MREVIDGANSQDISEPIPISYIDQMLNFSDGMGPYKPSMMIDREVGRPLELEALFLRPVTLAADRW